MTELGRMSMLIVRMRSHISALIPFTLACQTLKTSLGIASGWTFGVDFWRSFRLCIFETIEGFMIDFYILVCSAFLVVG